MSEPIGPGDFVECINREPHPGWAPLAGQGGVYRLRVGAVYRVEGLRPYDGVLLERVRSDHPDGSFNTCHFRPIYRRRDAESLTAKLLEGARAKGPIVPASVDREGSRETIKQDVGQ